MNAKIKSLFKYVLVFSAACVLESIGCNKEIATYAKDNNAQTEMDEEGANLYDEIEFIDELTFDTRNIVESQITQIDSRCNEYIVSHSYTQTDASIYIKNYYKLVNLKEKLNYYKEAEESGLLVELEFDKNEIKKGDILTITVNARNVGSVNLENINYSALYRKAILEAVDDVSGTFNLSIGERKTFTIKLKALEGGYDNIHIQFEKDNNKICAPTDALFIDSPGYFFLDGHTHSNRSDGAISMNDNLRYALNNGMNTLYATDHNAYVESLTDVLDAEAANKEVASTRFLYLKGSEFTDYNGGAGHAVYYNPVKHYPTPASSKGYKELIHTVINDGALFYMAHPFDTGSVSFKPLVRARDDETIDEFLEIFDEQTGTEVMSFYQWNEANISKSVANYLEETLRHLKLWDYLNIKGYKKYFGLANSDAHWATALGMNRNGLYLEEFTEECINNTLSNGRFYLTNGPELRFNIGDKTYGETIITSDQVNKDASIKVWGTTTPITNVSLIKYTINENYKEGYQAAERTVIFDDVNASQNKYYFEWNENLTIKPNEFYRVEVLASDYDGQVMQAYSNPIWVSNATNDFSIDKTSIELNPGETAKVNFTVDNLHDSVSVSHNGKGKIEALDNGFVKAITSESGTYTLTYTTESGKKVECTVTVKGTDVNNQEKEEGCKGSISASFGTVISLIGVLVCLLDKRREKYEK